MNTFRISLLLTLFCFVTGAATAQTSAAWQKVYGSNSYDQGRSVIETFDRGYVVAGSTSSWGGGNSDAYLMKVDSLGNFLWSQTIGGPNVEWAIDLVQTPDSGFAVVGYTNDQNGNGGYDMYLMRTDSGGNLLWDTTYGGSDWDFGYTIENTYDGGFLLAGETYSSGNGNNDAWVMRTDGNGVVLWDSVFGGAGNDIIHASCNAGSDFVLVGETNSWGNGGKDAWMRRIDANGVTVWDTTFGGMMDEIAWDVDSTIDGFAVAGYNESESGQGDFWMFMQEENNQGMIWDIFFGDPNEPEHGRGIAYGVFNGFRLMTAGTSVSGSGPPGDMMYMLTSVNGGWVGGATIGGGGTLEDIYGLIVTSENGFLAVGSSDGFNANYSSVYLVKMNDLGTTTSTVVEVVDPNSIEEAGTFAGLQLFPNPMQDQVTMELPESLWKNGAQVMLRDMSGRLLLTEQVIGSRHTLHRNDLPVGLYLVEVVTPESQVTLKLVITD